MLYLHGDSCLCVISGLVLSTSATKGILRTFRSYLEPSLATSSTEALACARLLDQFRLPPSQGDLREHLHDLKGGKHPRLNGRHDHSVPWFPDSDFGWRDSPLFRNFPGWWETILTVDMFGIHPRSPERKRILFVTVHFRLGNPAQAAHGSQPEPFFEREREGPSSFRISCAHRGTRTSPMTRRFSILLYWKSFVGRHWWIWQTADSHSVGRPGNPLLLLWGTSGISISPYPIRPGEPESTNGQRFLRNRAHPHWSREICGGGRSRPQWVGRANEAASLHSKTSFAWSLGTWARGEGAHEVQRPQVEHLAPSDSSHPSLSLLALPHPAEFG